MGTAPLPHQDHPRHPRFDPPLSWRLEIASVFAGLVVYFGGRVLVEGSDARATANAAWLLDIEADLGIDVESALQEVALSNDLIRVLGNLSYVWLHWPLLVTALIVLYFRDPSRYRQFRNALFVSGSVGLVLFAVVPMAPPRFMPGFVGTVSDDARRHYLDYPLSWTNKYAAFPSFHVGWTLIACLAVAATVDRRGVRVVALVPAALVGVSVITTGNHYVIDSVTGAAIALVAYLTLGWAGSLDRLRHDRHRHGTASSREEPTDTGAALRIASTGGRAS